MAITGGKIAKKLRNIGSFGDPTGLVAKGTKSLERKGFFPTANLAKQKTKEKEAEKTKKLSIRKQGQSEGLRLAEITDEIGRARLLRRTGGRQSLVAR